MTINIASYIDHTVLRANATVADIDNLCKEAIEHRFAAVCVNPVYAARAASMLAGTGVRTCTVVGFPLGATYPAAKAKEAELAVADGATEIDTVIPVGLLKAGYFDRVREDIFAVVQASGDAVVKVILENCLLTEKEIVTACQLCVEAGADFVKTSTGFSTSGATIEHVALMRKTVGEGYGVKAAGGIRDLATTLAMIEAGASRIGTSNGVGIMKELMAAR